MTAAPVGHPVIPVFAERGGTQLQAPRATLLVDTREQTPFNFSRFRGWLAGVEKKTLPLGDYSIAGLKDICVVEPKDHSDLIHPYTAVSLSMTYLSSHTRVNTCEQRSHNQQCLTPWIPPGESDVELLIAFCRDCRDISVTA